MSSTGSRLRLRAGAMVAGLLVITSGLIAVVGAPAKGQSAVAGSSARTEAEAVALAAATGRRIEVEGKTTEYSRTFVAPDGVLTAELSNTPVRVNRGGQWVPVDATLEMRSDGSVAAKAAYADVRFSGGGSGPLAVFSTESSSFSVSSPWPLGQPVLSGSTATYAEVLPGVDLVVDAAVEGFSHNLVVKTRAAAANPALRSVRFPVSTSGLEIRNTVPGRPSYVDTDGRAMLTVGEALMWDSAGSQSQPSGRSSDLVGEGPPPGSNTAEMELSGDATGLTIEPNAAMLADAATVFPVVLDPTMLSYRNRNAWAAAWQLYPNMSFYKTNHSLGVGFEDYEQHKIVRSFWQFDVAGFAGKKIVNAQFQVYSIHSANCTPKPVTVSRVSPISAATTWNNQPRWQADIASGTFAKGYSSACPDGYYDFTVTGSMQASATGHSASTTFRLRATDETDGIAWKQFNSSGKLTVQYISYPLAPYDLGAAAESGDPYKDCASSSNPTVLANVRPRFSARGRVGSGDSRALVKVQIQVVNPSGSYWTMTTSSVDKPGELRHLAMQYNLANNTLFRFHARTLYPYSGGELVGPWSGDCYFKIDTVAPPPPTITVSYKGQALANCYTTSPNPCPEIVPFGDAATYAIHSSATDVVMLRYWFGGAAFTQVNGPSVTVGLYPPRQGHLVMYAVVLDAAGHWSRTAAFMINVGPGTPPVAIWSMDGTAVDSSGNGRDLTTSGTTFDDDGRMTGSLVLGGDGDYATVSPAPVDTSKSFTISAWVRLTGSWGEAGVVGVPGAQALGAQLYYSTGAHRWVFIQSTSDSTSAGQARVQSVDPPLWGSWTHLAAVFDASARKIALYVNGRLQDSAAFTHAPWRATGALQIGRYGVGGSFGAPFSGSIDQVQLWARPMLAAEVAQNANPRSGPSGADETVAGLAARWPFDNAYLGADQVWRTGESVYSANMTLSGFGATSDQTPAFADDDERGRVLSMTGKAAESVSLPRQVVDAQGSFTVSVWVRMADTSRRQVIVRQAGTYKDSWRIEYVPPPTGEINGSWLFSRATGDSSTASDVAIAAPTSVDAAGDDWTLLVGIYDAHLNRIRLLVRNQASDDGAVFSSPVRTGTTIVGTAAAAGSKLNGLLDDLRLYSGVVSDRRVCTELLGLGETECSS